MMPAARALRAQQKAMPVIGYLSSSSRGSDGPLTTRWSRYPDPLSGAFVDAGIASGFPATDYNGAQREGFGRWQNDPRLQTMQRRGRLSAAGFSAPWAGGSDRRARNPKRAATLSTPEAS
jgi:hypothetical protein